MCSIDRQDNCTNWYCSCSGRVYRIHLNKKWLIYEVEERSLWNRVIGWFINLWRKPSIYPPKLSTEERKIRNSKIDEMRFRFGLLEDTYSPKTYPLTEL